MPRCRCYRPGFTKARFRYARAPLARVEPGYVVAGRGNESAPPEPVAMAAFDDAYLVPTEFQVATVEACP